MSLIERDTASILHTYNRLSLEVSHGEGMYLVDGSGKRYLDFVGGIAVNALGYGHQRLMDAMTAQIRRYVHVSNYFAQEPQIELAERLRAITGFSRVFFCNTGTEATEGTLKLVRKWGDGQGRSTVIAMENSFHGRTMGALSLMDNQDYRAGFGPFLPGCASVPMNDMGALQQAVSKRTTAIFIECIQGEGGIVEVTSEYAAELMKLRDELGFLVVADEVQTGLGRTGKFFAYEHYGLRPDIVMIAKPLGGGIPLGAILISEQLKDVFKPGMHGTTFGGNPVACAAGLIVLDEVETRLMKNAGETGAYFIGRLNEIQKKYPDKIVAVRGKGLMVGMEMKSPCKEIVAAMLEKNILVNCTHNTVLRFLPPLIATREDVDVVCEGLEHTLLQHRQ